MSALKRIVERIHPSLAAHARADLEGAGRFDPPGADPERAVVLEAVYEGWLMHYGSPRAFVGLDDDLRLLGGDALYATGLEALAETGDLDAVTELADLISLCARAAAEGRDELPDRLWEASAAVLAGGGGAGARRTLGAAFERPPGDAQ